jgi:DNA-directed RNA polymerase specialized sigma24 family protein
LERNADWIKEYISISASVLQEYLTWFFERLKDRVPPEASEQDVDRLVRAEVKSIYGEFRDRPAGPPCLVDMADPSGTRFEVDLEDAHELRASLECVPPETRELIVRAFAITQHDLASGRNGLAARFGISRNALDQRLSRAYKRIRERMDQSRRRQKNLRGT